MTRAEAETHPQWLKRLKDTYAKTPHEFGCKCQGCHCSICNHEYYWSANAGCYTCRNFDCPPGTEKRHQDSWDLVERLQGVLLQQKAADLTVAEIALIIQGGAGESEGPRMRAIAERLGIPIPRSRKS